MCMSAVHISFTSEQFRYTMVWLFVWTISWKDFFDSFRYGAFFVLLYFGVERHCRSLTEFDRNGRSRIFMSRMENSVK